MDDLMPNSRASVKTVITRKPVNFTLLEHDIPTRLAERVYRVDSHKGSFCAN